MSKNYDMIATVDIDIATPIVDDTSFDNLLIMGPAPKTGAKSPARVGVYSDISEVEDAGFVTSGADADPVGLAASVAFAQSPRPTAVYIAVQQLSEGAVVAGRTIKDANAAVAQYAGKKEGLTGCAISFKESARKLSMVLDGPITGVKNTGLFDMLAALIADGYTATIEDTVITDGASFKACPVWSRLKKMDKGDEDIPPANRYINVAFVAKWLNYESGSETTAFKQLASVYPSKLTSTEMKALADKSLNYFITVGSKNLSMNGKVIGNEWADIIRFRDWLKNDMQLRVVNLFVTRPKVPYTDAGISLVQNQMIASLKSGQDAGGIAESEFDEDGTEIPGYVTSVPLAASLSASEKASRKLTKCKFKARLAGAIHFAELKGSLTYEL